MRAWQRQTQISIHRIPWLIEDLLVLHLWLEGKLRERQQQEDRCTYAGCILMKETLFTSGK